MSAQRKAQSGFTLLEVLVATTIMGIAVVGLLSALSASMRNASRLISYDRAVMMARNKMDELLVDHRIPAGSVLNGNFDASSGWSARFTTFETLPGSPQNTNMLERVELQIWWMTPSGERRVFPLEGYRHNTIRPMPIP